MGACESAETSKMVAGRGPGAALGVLAIVVVAIGTWLSHMVVERTSHRFAPRPLDQDLPPLPAVAAATHGEQR